MQQGIKLNIVKHIAKCSGVTFLGSPQRDMILSGTDLSCIHFMKAYCERMFQLKFSKKLQHKQMLNFIKKYIILNYDQFAFTPGPYTSVAIFQFFFYNVYEALNKNKVLLAFLLMFPMGFIQLTLKYYCVSQIFLVSEANIIMAQLVFK